MSNNDSALEARPRRFHFDWLLPALTRPGPALARALEQPNDTWLTPILVLMLTGLGHALAAGWVRAANPPVMSLPEQFQYWSPDQQAQFMQAQAATQGPVFLYVFPGVFALLEVWVGWLVATGLLHLALTLLGGRGHTRITLNLVAWASLPFAVRDGVRIVALAATRQLILSPGLSGFAPAGDTAWGLYAAQVLRLVDVYVIWHLMLLVAGARVSHGLPRGKAALGAALSLLGLLLLQALPGFLAARFSQISVALPFFGY